MRRQHHAPAAVRGGGPADPVLQRAGVSRCVSLRGYGGGILGLSRSVCWFGHVKESVSSYGLSEAVKRSVVTSFNEGKTSATHHPSQTAAL